MFRTLKLLISCDICKIPMPFLYLQSYTFINFRNLNCLIENTLWKSRLFRGRRLLHQDWQLPEPPRTQVRERKEVIRHGLLGEGAVRVKRNLSLFQRYDVVNYINKTAVYVCCYVVIVLALFFWQSSRNRLACG